MPPALSRQPTNAAALPPSGPQTPRVLRAARRSAGAVAAIAAAAGVLVTVGLADPGLAQTADPALGLVIDRLRTVLVGLLVGLATLFLTLGGVRYLFAGGDPGQVEKAKITLRSAAIGYGLAALAPALVRLLRYVVGA
jgi:hypothetical protein